MNRPDFIESHSGSVVPNWMLLLQQLAVQTCPNLYRISVSDGSLISELLLVMIGRRTEEQ